MEILCHISYILKDPELRIIFFKCIAQLTVDSDAVICLLHGWFIASCSRTLVENRGIPSHTHKQQPTSNLQTHARHRRISFVISVAAAVSLLLLPRVNSEH